MEDIINLIDGRPELIEEIRRSSEELRAYLAEEIEGLLGETGFFDGLSWQLGPSEIEQARVAMVIERLRGIAGL